MKRKLFFIAVLLISMAGMNANAQFKLGGGLAFGSNNLGLGISANGTYTFNENWEAAPSFTFYFGDEFSNYWTLDLAGHYVFSSDDQKSFYALGGLEILGVTVDIPSFGGFGGGSASSSKVGLVLGAGGRLELNDKLSGFGDVKLGITDITYIGFNVGLLYSL